MHSCLCWSHGTDRSKQLLNLMQGNNLKRSHRSVGIRNSSAPMARQWVIRLQICIRIILRRIRLIIRNLSNAIYEEIASCSHENDDDAKTETFSQFSSNLPLKSMFRQLFRDGDRIGCVLLCFTLWMRCNSISMLLFSWFFFCMFNKMVDFVGFENRWRVHCTQ